MRWLPRGVPAVKKAKSVATAQRPTVELAVTNFFPTSSAAPHNQKCSRVCFFPGSDSAKILRMRRDIRTGFSSIEHGQIVSATQIIKGRLPEFGWELSD